MLKWQACNVLSIDISMALIVLEHESSLIRHTEVRRLPLLSLRILLQQVLVFVNCKSTRITEIWRSIVSLHSIFALWMAMRGKEYCLKVVKRLGKLQSGGPVQVCDFYPVWSSRQGLDRDWIELSIQIDSSSRKDVSPATARYLTDILLSGQAWLAPWQDFVFWHNAYLADTYESWPHIIELFPVSPVSVDS